MTEAELESAYLFVRDLGDGRKAGFMPLMFGRARIVTWRIGDALSLLNLW